MSTAMAAPQLRRPEARRGAISIVPLIDVLLIMLVFFMVTSTYLDLDMIPLAAPADEAGAGDGADTETLFVRIAADGTIVAAGERLTLDAFATFLDSRVRTASDLSVLVLPSARSDLQTLVSVMDRATASGAGSVRVVRLAAE